MHLYIININTLPDPKFNSDIMKDLPDERVKKCLGFKAEDDRKRSLGAGIIINNILNGEEIVYGKKGKPKAENKFFNISHSGDYVIGITAMDEVGCDIEKMDSAPLKVAERYFCKREIEYIENHENKDVAFWRLWTLKESYMKMTGEGMTLGLKSFEAVIDNDDITLYRNNEKQLCGFHNFIEDGYMISVCTKDMSNIIRIL